MFRCSNYACCMKNITLILIIGFLVLSCSTKPEEFKGDLYFKLIDIGSFYGADEKAIEKIEKYIDSIQQNESAEKDELEIIRVFEILKANDLIKSPWINLKTESDIMRIYLSESEYEKLKQFDRNKLIANNQKVELTIKVIELDSGIYYSNKVLKMNLTEGKTYWRK